MSAPGIEADIDVFIESVLLRIIKAIRQSGVTLPLSL